jgi:hypothetical protein
MRHSWRKSWAQTTLALLVAAAAGQAAIAQNVSPRSWKSYFPAQSTQVGQHQSEDEMGDEALAPIHSPESYANTSPAARTQLASFQEQTELPPTAPPTVPPEDDGAIPPAPSGPYSAGPGPMEPMSGMPYVDSCCSPVPGCGGLSAGCGDVCNVCCPTRNFAKIEYLMWWGRGRSLPPLVTTSFDGTPMADAGVLGEPSTTILYGNNDVGSDWRSGGRLTVGRQLDEAGVWTAVGRFYGLGDSSDSYHAESAAGAPILARPFFNVLLAQQDALLVAYPGVSTNGVIDVESRADMLGADAFIRRAWMGNENWQLDLLGGYQFSRLDDSLVIRNSELVLMDPQAIFPPNTEISMRDSFRTKNEFHGGVLGLAADFYRGPWKLSLLGKMAIGNQRQSVTIDGNTAITPNMGPTTTAPVGLLARSTNIGEYSRDVFTFMPEANFTLAYQHNYWTFSVGYSFLYWNDVAWAGDQVDLRVNLSDPVIGDQLPAFAFRDTDFWVQGISFGAEYSF